METQKSIALEGEKQPAFLEGTCGTEELAARAASMWKSVPTNRMQLPEHLTAADADGARARFFMLRWSRVSLAHPGSRRAQATARSTARSGPIS